VGKYIVYVDNNARHADETARYKLAEFATYETAVAMCRKIVDKFFQEYKPGQQSFEKLWEQYTTFGEDPFIVSAEKKQQFSAWDHAKERCRELCAGPAGE